MIRFGMPYLLEIESMEETAALCAELGLSFVELNMNFPQFQIDAVDVPLLRALARKYGIFYTLHLDDNISIADFNPAVARAWTDTVLRAAALARELEMPVLNMHLSRGGVVTLPHRKAYLYEAYRDRYLSRIRAFRDCCHRAVGDAPLRICVENTAGFPDWQAEALDVLLESPVFGLTWDVGHDHCTGGGDGEHIRRRIGRLHHMHLHDACRPGRDHLALGTGELDIGALLSLARQQDCTVVLETKTVRALRSSVSWLKDNRK